MSIKLSQSLSLKIIEMNDFEALYSLMLTIYPPAYQYLWNDDCTWYLNHLYNKDSVLQDIEDDSSHLFFVMDNDVEVGILKIQPDIPYPEKPGKKATRLHRIYLHESAQGKGISTLLMKYVLDVAAKNKSEILWLDCMDSKHQALKYYEKHGFQKDTLSFLDYKLLKDEYRGIYLMWKEL